MSFDPRILSFYTDEEREKLVQGGWIPPYYSSVLSGFNSNSASTSAAEALAATAAVASAATTGLLHSVDENYGGNYNHLRIEEKNQGGREGSANNNTAKKEVLSREKKKHIVDKSTAVTATTSKCAFYEDFCITQQFKELDRKDVFLPNICNKLI